MKQKDNFQMYMSTATYELTKAKLPIILKNYTDNRCLAISTHRVLDLNIAEEDTRFRVLNQLKTGKAGNKLKITIVNLFIENILPKIKESINANCNNLNELNYRIKNSIDRNKKTGSVEHQQMTAKSPKPTSESEESVRTNQIEAITYKGMQAETESIEICPVCQKPAEGQTQIIETSLSAHYPTDSFQPEKDSHEKQARANINVPHLNDLDTHKKETKEASKGASMNKFEEAHTIVFCGGMNDILLKERNNSHDTKLTKFVKTNKLNIHQEMITNSMPTFYHNDSKSTSQIDYISSNNDVINTAMVMEHDPMHSSTHLPIIANLTKRLKTEAKKGKKSHTTYKLLCSLADR
ncbi:unnamed protein product [Mytilus coruscus]|uniref:Endonuclease/exonuclease/phosphatase domain-containing protein n=1 Tax=Mytilus coruscus TaxID=42192 RepID=A0A6J8C333_MYTCO|nr:unnamed protein product [Mytilus coruscus]